MQKKVHDLVNSFGFMIAINLVIVVNAILIGVETFYKPPTIVFIQSAILGIFILEIIVRYIGKESVKEYFTNGWNLFDILIVSISLIPEAYLDNSAALSVFRVMRVFRVLRLVRTLPELELIVSVLLKSLKSLGYTFMLLGIFMYMYSIMGVVLFKGGPAAANGPGYGPTSPDPYGTIREAFFSLFRIMTGEDWTDLRYNLLGGQVPGASDWLVTVYHVSWMGISAFLLINLVVGAVVNNYDQVMAEHRAEKEAEHDAEIKAHDLKRDHQIEMLNTKLDQVNAKLETLLNERSHPPPTS